MISKRRTPHYCSVAAMFLSLLFLLQSAAAIAAPRVEGAWARATPPGARAGAVYLTLTGGEAPDRLLGGSTPAARELQIHTHVHADGMMRMEQLPDLAIGVGQTHEFRPHGLHLMLMGLKGPLVAGEEILVTLEFEQAGMLELAVPVRDAR